MPRHFQPLQIGEYTGTSDLEDHLYRFKNASQLHQYNNGVKCRVFLTTLARLSQCWFNRLKPRFIGFFEDFSTLFLHHFASSKRYHKTPLSLFSMKQQNKETLREYIQHFNQLVLEVPSTILEILVSIFSQGLVEGNFFRSLAKKPSASYDELMGRAKKIHQHGENRTSKETRA